MNVFETDKEYVANTYNRYPICIAHGEGVYAYDTEGNRYVDMGSGIGVNIFGYSDKEWREAVWNQLATVQHTSNLYYTKPCAYLAKELCERTGFKKVFFGNSGAEANETAIKAARKYAMEHKGEGYHNIVTLTGSFHGRTHTTLAATGQEAFHKLYTPLTEGFIYSEPTIEALKEAVENNKVGAIMFEIIRGEGGVLPLDREFVDFMVALARKEDILLICDEVQTGNGRTGALYAYMHYNFMPDIVTTAKGLGGGLPIGACMLSEKVENIFGYGDNGSTFGGNPVCAAGAYHILKRLDDEQMDEVTEGFKYLKNRLSKVPGIESITGMGFMIGIKYKRPASEVVKYCMEHGVLVLTAKDKVRLLPPLNIPMEVFIDTLDVLADAASA